MMDKKLASPIYSDTSLKNKSHDLNYLLVRSNLLLIQCLLKCFSGEVIDIAILSSIWIDRHTEKLAIAYRSFLESLQQLSLDGRLDSGGNKCLGLQHTGTITTSDACTYLSPRLSLLNLSV